MRPAPRRRTSVLLSLLATLLAVLLVAACSSGADDSGADGLPAERPGGRAMLCVIMRGAEGVVGQDAGQRIGLRCIMLPPAWMMTS